ncbi:transcriptional repressor [Acidiferrimicrobium sp. IK]|uniref:Fur family transcriptional regulator n=1 Tax=Acidiferrimicrobium sp. IK TaxID=2871700 RepID=UPI0021CB691D|nr:transcriptional repressor [Acidiferrimicrobium sp. IK]MCU4186073.1 transcriptional repressor [Acidiferrimicrobium sp. IK]
MRARAAVERGVDPVGQSTADGAEDRVAEDRVAEVMDLLRARGGRASGARRVILEAMATGPAHRTAEELAEQIHAEHPAVHQATVYRTLERFEELGVVYHSHLGHGPAQWHLGENHHVHLTCDRCGAVIDADQADFEEVAAALRDRYGFSLDIRHFAITGTCAGCADGDGRDPW